MSKELFFLAVDCSLIDYSSGQENELVLRETIETFQLRLLLVFRVLC